MTLPVIAAYRIASAVSPRPVDNTYQGFSQLVSLLPGTMGNLLRRSFYRWTLQRCSRSCTISFGTLFATPEAEIGEHVYIGPHCMIGHATIEDDVLLGSNVDLLSGKRQHHFDRVDIPIRLQGGTYERITIGRDAWLGNGALTLADVGPHAVVAAGAVVVRPVGAWEIVGGNPARVLGRRGEAPDETITERRPEGR